MGFKYLNSSNWRDITRDERYFCAELFFEIRNDTLSFVKWLKDRNICEIPAEELKNEWEIGYEVCFYRDFIKKFGDEKGIKFIRQTEYSQKRTFDLCLFSEKRIIIIEAKSQQKFKTEQNEEFQKDILSMKKLLEKSPDSLSLNVIALASSIYFQNVAIYGKGLSGVFNGKYFSWKDVYDSFSTKIVFDNADKSYKK